MDPIKTAVIGVGYLGKFHAEKYARNEKSELVGIYDPDEKTAGEVAQKLGCRVFVNLDELLDSTEAVSIVAPTPKHYEIAKRVLEKGLHCFVEKPITDQLEHARKLIALKNHKNLKLQVGHLERYNPAFRRLLAQIKKPSYIETSRISGYLLRSANTHVLLDLMIHDIDLILKLCNSKPYKIEAHGVKVLSETFDMAMLRIHFENDCVADLKSGRLSPKAERKIRVFQENAYFSADLNSQSLKSYKTVKKPGEKEISIIPAEQTFEKIDMIYKELDQFLDCIRENTNPPVTAEEAAEALKIAIQAIEQLA